MRDLKDWYGDKVLFSGFVEDWKRSSKDKSKGHILLSNVTLKKLDGDTTRYFDHLWIGNYPDYDNLSKKLERLNVGFGTAEVIKYRRKDGSQDYSISHLSGKYIIEKLNHDLNLLILKNAPRKKIKEKVLFMKYVLESKNFLVSNLKSFNYQDRLKYCNNILAKVG